MIVILLFKIFILSVVINYLFEGRFDMFLAEMHSQPYKLALYFLAAYFIGAVFMFPAVLLGATMAYAYTHIFGVLYGSLFTLVLNYICMTISYSFVFLVTRYVFGDYVYARCIQNRLFFQFDRAVQLKGAWILFLLRSSCIVPHTILNYASAVTDLSFVQFSIGNTAILPVSLLWIYWGTSAASL